MGIEILLYGYGAVCVGMIIFNFVYNMILKGSDSRLKKRSKKYRKKVTQQIDRIQDGQEVQKKHFSYLEKRLCHVHNLMAFDRALENITPNDEQAFAEYMGLLQPVMLYLAGVYQKRDNLQCAYFAYFIEKHNLKNYMNMDGIQSVMIEYMNKDSLYCRINTLQALYTFGDEKSVTEAISILDRSDSFMHEKILTDGLLSFKGDHNKLIHMLWGKIEDFSERVQLSILNYIRFKSGDYREEMFAIMQDKSKDKEIRLSAIRYFGKYIYEKAKEPLIAFVSDKNPINWEYAAISATSLARYEGEDVLNVLMEAMHSSNWYVRYNASISLENHHLNYRDLIEVVGGKDRYAREMIMYRLDSRRLEQEDKGAAT